MRVTIDSLKDGQPVEVFPGLFIYTPPQLDYYEDEHPIGALLMEATLNSPSVPHAGFGYSVLEGSFIERAAQAYRLFRLSDIRQLGFLEDPDTPPDERPFQPRFNHTRWLHSLDVAAFAGAIVYNNRAWFNAHPGTTRL